MTASPLLTIVAQFCQRAAESPQGVALHIPSGSGFRAVRWGELADDVRRTAAALLALGVSPDDRIALVSRNRYEWIVSDLAIQMAGAVHVPMHASLTGPQILAQLRDCTPRVLFIAGPDEAERLAGAQLAPGMLVVSFDACTARIGTTPIRRLSELAAKISPEEAERVEEEGLEHVRLDDLATILYTSGTTGESKGVMLTQRNLASNAVATLAVVSLEPGALRLGWLPLSHIFARTCDLYTWLYGDTELAIVGAAEAVLPACAQLRPHALNGVPYFFEKTYRYLVQEKRADDPGALDKLFGGRLKLGMSGGAPLPDHIAEYYERQGVVLLQGYGLTESSPVITTQTLERRKLGTVGPPVPGVEVKIASDGEILTRGPHVMLGYWNKPDATREALKGGWLHTGDLGALDDDGFLRITGRKKELIVTSAGKNIAPAYLECLLLADPLIEQAMIIGDGRSYLVALIVPHRAELTAAAKERGWKLDPTALFTDARVTQLYAERILQRLRDVSHHEQVRKFALLEHPFTAATGELTLTLKLRRGEIAQKYAREIAALYSCEEPTQPC